MSLRVLLVSLLLGGLFLVPVLAGDEAATKPTEGTIAFKTVGNPADLPEAYRLGEHTFDYQLTLRRSLSMGYDLYDLKFPSPVESETPANNTVVAEYFRPRGPGPFPGVILLDILDGSQLVTRAQANSYAQQGIAALCVQMAYYGPRRKGTNKRLVSTDLEHSLRAVRQTVLDVRRAAAWLAEQPEIDAEKLGLCGTSLGSFMGTLSAEMEPRIKRVAIVLGGGGLVEAFYLNPRVKALRDLYEVMGGSQAKLEARLAPIDPLTAAANLKDRRVLMIGASRDEVVPPAATRRLWEAVGRPKIIWYDATHTGAAAYLPQAMKEAIQFFKE